MRLQLLDIGSFVNPPLNIDIENGFFPMRAVLDAKSGQSATDAG